LTWNEFVEFEIFEFNLSLALDQDNKGVGGLVEEFFINLWLEKVDLLEIIVVKFD
jgi:hypothetical protein